MKPLWSFCPRKTQTAKIIMQIGVIWINVVIRWNKRDKFNLITLGVMRVCVLSTFGHKSSLSIRSLKYDLLPWRLFVWRFVHMLLRSYTIYFILKRSISVIFQPSIWIVWTYFKHLLKHIRLWCVVTLLFILFFLIGRKEHKNVEKKLIYNFFFWHFHCLCAFWQKLWIFIRSVDGTDNFTFQNIWNGFSLDFRLIENTSYWKSIFFLNILVEFVVVVVVHTPSLYTFIKWFFLVCI